MITGVILISLVATLVWAVQSKVAIDTRLAIENFRTVSSHSAHEAAQAVDEKLRQIQQGLRTISLLPSVRNISRHGENIDDDALQSIQQLYNNLASDVDISEVYIVPVTLDPDRVDPTTGEAEEPIAMFDELIVNAAAKAKAQLTKDRQDASDEEADPEVEIFEYRALKGQMDWLKAHYPNDSGFAGLARPMIPSEELITCDNTVYVHTKRDADRSGIILSVPFYGFDGALKGTISAIIRTGALVGYLPPRDNALVNMGHGYVALSREGGVERSSLQKVRQGQPDPALLFSTAIPLDEKELQGSWFFWSGLPNSAFFDGPQARAIRQFELAAYVIIALLAVSATGAFLFVLSRARLSRMQRKHLEEIAEARSQQLISLERAQGEIIAAKNLAEAASLSKSQFLANMSHEIRTPLNGVLGIAQALEAETLGVGQKEKVALILDSGKTLMTLLNDVLDLSKIEAGKLEIAPVPGDFLHTVKRTYLLFQTQAQEKGLTLEFRCTGDFPPRLRYDPVRVRQCISNLLSNAIKFTERGRIRVSISAKPQSDGSFMIMVSVADTGIGMNADAVGRLFTAFNQADNSTTRRFGGTGLGLAISRRLARMMGGDIRVRSEEGRGSSFTFFFHAEAAPVEANPATTSRVSASPPPSSGTLRGARILLTDDNALNRQVIKLFLVPHGCEIVEATNGKEALDQLAAASFDLVLLDAHMPVMDGAAAIKAIRASTCPWNSIPVIALTADAMAGDREKYLALGMTDYLSKPVDQRELIAKMSILLKIGSSADFRKTGTS